MRYEWARAVRLPSCRTLGDHDVEGKRFASPPQVEPERAADAVGAEAAHQRADAADGRAVDGDDHVSLAYACACAWTALIHRHDDRAQAAVDRRELQPEAQISARHASLVAQQGRD